MANNDKTTYNSASVQLLVKKQADSDTYLLPVYATDNNIKFYDVENVKTDFGHTGGGNLADGTMFTGESISGKKPKGISAGTKLRWSGSLAVAPKDWVLFESAGCRVDTTGAEAKVIWDGLPSCAVLSIDRYVWRSCPAREAIVEKIASAVGNFTVTMDGIGSEAVIKWDFQGKDAGESAFSSAFALPSGTDNVFKGEQLLGATFTHAGNVYRIWSATYNHGATAQEVPNSADLCNTIKTGIAHYKIGGKQQSTLEVEATLVTLAESNPNSAARNNDVAVSTIFDFEHLTWTFAGTQITAVERGDQNETPTQKFTIKTKEWEIVQKL